MTTGNRNVAVGMEASQYNTVGTQNSSLGYQALWKNTANDNTAVGSMALRLNTTGTRNTALGYQALTANTSAHNNVAVGYQALDSNTTGHGNIGIGSNSLNVNTGGASNIAVGQNALAANTTANFNLAIGFESLLSTTSGSNNVGVGAYSLSANTTASGNTAFGYQSMKANTTAADNTALGYNAMLVSTTGAYNTAVGNIALSGLTTGSFNTGVGRTALNGVTTGSKNISLGFGSGRDITTGSDNVIIGDWGGSATLASTVAIYAGTTERLKVDSSGLTVNGAAVGGAGVHTLLSTTKITSNTASIEITGIDAKYKIILVKYALRGATNMSAAKLVLGVGGTWTTGNDYTTGSNAIASMQLDGGWARQQGAGHFEIFNLGDSGARTAIFTKHMEMTDAYTSTTLLTPAVGKFATKNTTAYNSFKISGTYGGNYTSGFVNVYGIADS
jgi:hypothetical protein